MWRPVLYTLLAGAAAAAASRGASAASAGSSLGIDRAYAAFRQRHGVPELSPGGEQYSMRLALFAQRQAEVARLNARSGASWVAGLTHLADYTEAEFRDMLGYRRSSQWSTSRSVPSSSFLEAQPRLDAVAESMDWRLKLNTSANFFRNQGSCGSCWAVAAVGALEMHAESRQGPTAPLSFEQLVDCVPNPEHCGGEGGCRGATSELAFAYVAKHGLVHADAYKGYASGGDGVCRPPPAPPRSAAVSSSGFVQLPVNKYKPLLYALATKGPVVVSVDGSGWSLYEAGVFNDCQRDATVNHAVLMVGYGNDSERDKKFYVIRNSWGKSWGEQGTIRLERHESDVGEGGYCGTDRAPKDGNFCDGAPAEVPVCGMCGVLSDSSYPKDVRIAS